MEKVIANNRKAFHDYHILETFEAGIALKGTEAKSCRAGNVSLHDAFARIDGGEVILCNSHIAPYEQGNRFNHDPLRLRKLLLHGREIRRLAQMTNQKGHTIIPLKFYFKNGVVKVEIAIAKGKTQYDKRETLKRKQDEMDAKKAMSGGRRQRG